MLGLYRPAKPAGDCGDAAESDPTVQAFTVQQNSPQILRVRILTRQCQDLDRGRFLAGNRHGR